MPDRTHFESFEESSVRRTQTRSGPDRRLGRGRIESDRLLPGSDSIVIATDVVLRAVEHAHRIENLIRFGAITDEVAEADDVVEFFAADAAHDAAQRLGVRVQIAHDQRSHVSLQVELLAVSRKLFGSSSSRRSTISAGVSASRISRVMSAVL